MFFNSAWIVLISFYTDQPGTMARIIVDGAPICVPFCNFFSSITALKQLSKKIIDVWLMYINPLALSFSQLRDGSGARCFECMQAYNPFLCIAG